MSHVIEVPVPIAPDIYNGTINGYVFEQAEPGLVVTTNLIRTTQDWGVKVQWTMTGPLTEWLDADFHLRAYLESIGPGTEYSKPDDGDIIVNTLSVPLQYDADGKAFRSYETDIPIPAGTVEPHPYKIVAFLQLFSCCLREDQRRPHKYPVAGMYELPITDVFEPE
jgi:hypothetical protein